MPLSEKLPFRLVYRIIIPPEARNGKSRLASVLSYKREQDIKTKLVYLEGPNAQILGLYRSQILLSKLCLAVIIIIIIVIVIITVIFLGGVAS